MLKRVISQEVRLLAKEAGKPINNYPVPLGKWNRNQLSK